MIRINLLPWRDELKKERAQRFYTACAISGAISMACVYGIYILITNQVFGQKTVNGTLKQEIGILDKSLKEVSSLEAQLEILHGRKELIETLQQTRGDSVRLMNELVNITPDGVIFTALSQQQDGEFSVRGIAASNARVSALMSKVEASSLLSEANLIETKGVKYRGQRRQAFDIKFSVIKKDKQKKVTENQAPSGRVPG